MRTLRDDAARLGGFLNGTTSIVRPNGAYVGAIVAVSLHALRAKHRRASVCVYEKPAPTDIQRDDTESLLSACEVEVVERLGSRAGLRKGSERIVIHRPHPRPTQGRARSGDIAVVLKIEGVEP